MAIDFLINMNINFAAIRGKRTDQLLRIDLKNSASTCILQNVMLKLWLYFVQDFWIKPQETTLYIVNGV